MSSRVEGSKTGITIAVMCAALMALIDISIVNVALRDMQTSLGTTLSQIGWVSTGYMMSNVVVIPMTGWLQRRFGYRRYFTASILIFTAASVLCGTAWNLESLVLFRVLQGIGGGAIIPTAQAILFARYPQKEHNMAGALFGLGAVTGPLLGPTIGGYIIDAWNWHWIFLVNLPVGIVAAFLAWQQIREPESTPEERAASREPIDLVGIGLLIAGMASLQYVLEEGNRDSWFDSKTISVLIAVAAVALITFVVHELETPHPVVDLRVFKDRDYTAGTIINFILGISLFSGFFLFSLYCGTIMHYSAKDIGKIFLYAGALQVILMPLIGRFAGRFDGRMLVGIGVIGSVVALWMNGHLQSDAGFWDLTKPQMVRTGTMGLIFVPLSVITLSRLPAMQRGNAAGLFNLTRELGGSIGTAAMGLLLDRRAALHSAHLTDRLDAFNPMMTAQLRQLGALFVGHGVDTRTGALAVVASRVNTQSLVQSFNDGFLLAAAMFAVGMVFVFVIRKPVNAAPVAGAH